MTTTEREKLIQQYADGPRRLREALARVPAAGLKWRPAPGEWSAHEVICHCADSETASYARIRYVIAEPDPLIVGYDQEEWARKGRHTEIGEYPAEKWLELYAEHLEGHAQQIEKNLAAWQLTQR
jgi:hypothetical protein